MSQPFKCPVCNGDGKKVQIHSMFPYLSGVPNLIVTCNACKGTGIVWEPAENSKSFNPGEIKVKLKLDDTDFSERLLKTKKLIEETADTMNKAALQGKKLFNSTTIIESLVRSGKTFRFHEAIKAKYPECHWDDAARYMNTKVTVDPPLDADRSKPDANLLKKQKLTKLFNHFKENVYFWKLYENEITCQITLGTCTFDNQVNAFYKAVEELLCE